MLLKNVLKSGAIVLLCLNFVSCGPKQCNYQKKENRASPGVVNKKADVVVRNAAEVQSFQEEGDDAHIMTPRDKQVYYFSFDSSALNQQIRNALKKEAEFLVENPRTKIFLAGHADVRGSDDYNDALGNYRVESVAKYLTSLNVSSSQIKKRSYGKRNPVNTGLSEKAHAQNRRVVLSYESSLHI